MSSTNIFVQIRNDIKALSDKLDKVAAPDLSQVTASLETIKADTAAIKASSGQIEGLTTIVNSTNELVKQVLSALNPLSGGGGSGGVSLP